jgi:hypothetical protein
MSSRLLGTKNHHASEGHQQFACHHHHHQTDKHSFSIRTAEARGQRVAQLSEP